MSGSITIERLVDKIRELEARIRALERLAEDDRTLDDIRTSIGMLAESMANPATAASAAEARPAAAAAARPRDHDSRKTAARKDGEDSSSFTAMSDPRFRVI